MKKKCIICNADAVYCIKGTSDFYCEDCAQEAFGDVSMLLKVADEEAAIAARVDDFLNTEAEAAQADRKENPDMSTDDDADDTDDDEEEEPDDDGDDDESERSHQV